jgi:hypothetical protein
MQDNIPLNATGYTEETPGMIIILLDQSGSMNDTWGNAGRTKAAVAAEAVNRICQQLAKQCRLGGSWSKKVYLSVSGYRTDRTGEFPHFENLCSGWPNDFGPRFWQGHGANGDTTGLIQPFAEGATPMAEAIHGARRCIEKTFEAMPDLRQSFPPTVINITDAEADDIREGSGGGAATRQAASALQSIRTEMGNTLLFNLLINPDQRAERVFFDEQSARDLEGSAKFLFDISSPVPAFIRRKVQAESPGTVSPTSRGLIITSNPQVVISMLRWGSFTLPR